MRARPSEGPPCTETIPGHPHETIDRTERSRSGLRGTPARPGGRAAPPPVQDPPVVDAPIAPRHRVHAGRPEGDDAAQPGDIRPPLQPDFAGSRLAARKPRPPIEHDQARGGRRRPSWWPGGGTAGALAADRRRPDPRRQVRWRRAVHTEAQAPAPLTDAERKDAADKRRKELKVRARARHATRSPAHAVRQGSPPPTKKPVPGAGDPVPVGEAQKIAREMMSDFGWSPELAVRLPGEPVEQGKPLEHPRRQPFRARTGSRRRCPARRCPAPVRLAEQRPYPDQVGPTATSRAATAPRVAPGRTRSPPAGTDGRSTRDSIVSRNTSAVSCAQDRRSMALGLVPRRRPRRRGSGTRASPSTAAQRIVDAHKKGGHERADAGTPAADSGHQDD